MISNSFRCKESSEHATPPRPFDIIPVEILIYILTLAIQVQDADQLVQHVARKAVFPFTALDVCRHWREIVLSTPQMSTSAAIIMNAEWWPRLMEHTARCGGLPVHVDVVVSEDQSLREFEGSAAELNAVSYDTHIRSVRVIGTPQDQTKYALAPRSLGIAFNAGSHLIHHLELALRDGQAAWNNPLNTAWIATGVAWCCHLRSLTLTSFYLPPWDTQAGGHLYADLPCLDELYLRGCDAHTPQLLWKWTMPRLRTLVIDCIPQAIAVPPPPYLQRALRLRPEWPYLPTARHVILSNIHAHLDLQILLSAVPNATSLALTHLSTHPFPYRTDNQMTCLTRLTILDAAPDMCKLRAFVEAKTLALRVVELDGRCNMIANVELLGERIDVRFVSEEDMELDSVLGRMKSVEA